MGIEKQSVNIQAPAETMDTISWLKSQTAAMKTEREKRKRSEAEQNNRDEEMQEMQQMEDSLENVL